MNKRWKKSDLNISTLEKKYNINYFNILICNKLFAKIWLKFKKKEKTERQQKQEKIRKKKS